MGAFPSTILRTENSQPMVVNLVFLNNPLQAHFQKGPGHYSASVTVPFLITRKAVLKKNHTQLHGVTELNEVFVLGESTGKI